jgi:integrase
MKTRPNAGRRELTTRFCETITATKPTRFWDAIQRNLVLTVQASGHRCFHAYYYARPARRYFHIGRPDMIRLAAARAIAADVAAHAVAGRDPVAHMRSTAPARAMVTFRDMYEQYYQRWASRRNRSADRTYDLVRKELFPRWGDMPADQVTRGMVIAMRDDYAGTPNLANRLVAAAGAAYTWAINEAHLDGIDDSPVRKVKREPVKKRDRYLSDAEIRLVWPLLTGPVGAAIKLMLLTGCRGNEVCSMSRADIRDGWWTIRAEVAKNKSEFRVWLSRPALALVDEVADAGIRTNALGDVMRALPLDEPATPHACRHTFISFAQEREIATFEQAARLTNHKLRGVTADYTHATFAAEHRRLWERIGAAIVAVATGADAKVVQINK